MSAKNCRFIIQIVLLKPQSNSVALNSAKPPLTILFANLAYLIF